MTENEPKRTGYIYQIINMTNNKRYIGSTLQSVGKRWCSHKYDMKKQKHKHRPLYVDMRNLGVDAFRCEQLAEVQVRNRTELFKIEGDYQRRYDTFNNGYNSLVNGRTNKEYYQEYKQRLRDYGMDFRRTQPEKYRAQLEAKKIKVRCECGSIINKGAIYRHRNSHT